MYAGVHSSVNPQESHFTDKTSTVGGTLVVGEQVSELVIAMAEDRTLNSLSLSMILSVSLSLKE